MRDCRYIELVERTRGLETLATFDGAGVIEEGREAIAGRNRKRRDRQTTRD